MTLNIDEQLRLELTALTQAEELYQVVDINRAHLAAFLPWVHKMRSAADYRDYILHCEYMQEQKKEVSFAIINDEKIVGRIGLYNIDLMHKNASLGYWLIENSQGKGIMTRSCHALIKYAFDQLALHRIELKAAVKNIKSKSIAEKLNFTAEGIQREAELINNEYVDLALYSLLLHEWRR